MNWLHAIIAANLTMLAMNVFGMMVAPEFPGRFKNGLHFAGFMVMVWAGAVVGWSMVIR